MTRYFRYQLETLPELPLDYWSGWARARGGDTQESIYWLYDRTGDACPLHLRIPEGTQQARITVNGKAWSTPTGGQVVQVARTWQDGDVVTLQLPMAIETHRGKEEPYGTTTLRIGLIPTVRP